MAVKDSIINIHLSVASDDSGGNTLHYEGLPIDDAVCQQSETLKGLLETDGDATLPLTPSSFNAWLQFATSLTTPRLDTNGMESLTAILPLLEVSQFLHSNAIETRAAAKAAQLLRVSYRTDLLSYNADEISDIERTIFPWHIPDRPGPALQRVLDDLPPALAAAAAAAIVRQLTLCEALLLPPPFPAEALAHFLSLTAGVLDLSPPRVPAHSAASLRTITTKLAPLLASMPPLQALHIPAPCLTSLQPVSAILPHLSTVTRLCISYGKVTYDDLNTYGPMSADTAAALLRHCSPAALRHLSIDALVDPTTDPLYSVLCSFTALTHVRLPEPTAALSHMPALSSLCVTHMRHGRQDLYAAAWREILERASPEIEIHASGGQSVAACCYAEFLNAAHHSQKAGHPERTHLVHTHTPAGSKRHDEASHRSNITCCGYPLVHNAASLLQHKQALSGVASHRVHFFTYDRVHAAWALGGASDLAAPQSGSRPGPHASGDLATRLQELSITLPRVNNGVEKFADEIYRRIGAREADHTLSVLCVLEESDLPPHSALAPVRDDGEATWMLMRLLGIQQEPPDSFGRGWVTERRSGVAHPLCALEMLHCAYNAALPPPSRASEIVAQPRAPSGLGLHTLRLSLSVFPLIQDAMQAEPRRFAALQDLSILHAFGEATPYVGFTQVNLSGLALLTGLRTLSLQGVTDVCSAAGCLPPALTALLLHGADNEHAPFSELGARLLRLSGLQCLDMLVQLCSPCRDTLRAAADDDRLSVKRQNELQVEFWTGLRPALLHLPLHLGARVEMRIPDDEHALEWDPIDAIVDPMDM